MTPRNSWIRVVALAAASAFAVTACGGGSGSNTGGAQSEDPNAKITLKVNFWGDFGLKDLVTQYQAAHPNITIQLNPGEFAAQHEALLKSLVAGSGAPDISAVDEGYIVQMRAQSKKFVNLLDLGAGEYESKYLGWKWKQSLSADGKTQIGLGTDVGGLAMCYRTDLFRAAGLPTDRDKVSKLWPTWEKFVEVGKQYTAKTGKKFVDSAVNIFQPVLGQQPVGFFTEDDKLSQDGPKVAWDVASQIVNNKIGANLTQFSAEWDAGFKTGSFATLTCPAWMKAYIQGKAPAAKGKWDIAAIPGGGGNWGGSFWTIPKQGKHQQAAYDFVKWLVDPTQQIAIFKAVGNLPSQPALYTNPELLDFKDPYFSNAPVGKIFTESALKLKPQYLGTKNGQVRVAVDAALNSVQQGKTTPEAGWAKAMADAEKIANK